MPKKQATKKKKKAPTVQEYSKHTEDINFTIETEEQAQEVCAHLKQLETTMGWIYLKKMLQMNMEVLGRGILTKIDQTTGEKLTDDDVESMRRTYIVYEELVDKPTQLIKNISQGNVPTAPQYDPFAREISNKNDVQYAGVLRNEDEVEEE